MKHTSFAPQMAIHTIQVHCGNCGFRAPPQINWIWISGEGSGNSSPWLQGHHAVFFFYCFGFCRPFVISFIDCFLLPYFGESHPTPTMISTIACNWYSNCSLQLKYWYLMFTLSPLHDQQRLQVILLFSEVQGQLHLILFKNFLLSIQILTDSKENWSEYRETGHPYQYIPPRQSAERGWCYFSCCRRWLWSLLIRIPLITINIAVQW